MKGLLLLLRDDTEGWAAQWFWPCFAPLREAFDRRHWIFQQGAPGEFVHERVDFEGAESTSVVLGPPGTLGRWAELMFGEDILLWSPKPSDDAVQMAYRFTRTFTHQVVCAFLEQHADFWLMYTDSTCWEIFARDESLLQKVRDHLHGSESVQVYESDSADRARAYAQAGIMEVWRAADGYGS